VGKVGGEDGETKFDHKSQVRGTRFEVRGALREVYQPPGSTGVCGS
jgi:hypothetical protein